MTEFGLYQTTGLTPQELSEVFQQNPRAYMAVRGAVAEKHLDKVLAVFLESDQIDRYRGASGDMDKDFYVQRGANLLSLECKNVEVMKTSAKRERVDYLEYLMAQGYLSSLFIDNVLSEIGLSDSKF